MTVLPGDAPSFPRATTDEGLHPYPCRSGFRLLKPHAPAPGIDPVQARVLRRVA